MERPKMNKCKSICARSSATAGGSDRGGLGGGRRPYDMGYKLCTLCSVWLKTGGLRCGCCGTMLRSRKRKRRKPKAS
ncbi:MAG: hypothetical protein J4F28_02170 [Nitrosopumilaceae archaeon]|nr:hypothetical protein [Nitrosopumilaceae archaeon]